MEANGFACSRQLMPNGSKYYFLSLSKWINIVDNNKLVSSRKCDFYLSLALLFFKKKKKKTNFYYLKFLGQIYYIFPKWKALNRGTLLSFEELSDYLSHLYGEPLKILIDMAIANARTFVLRLFSSNWFSPFVL